MKYFVLASVLLLGYFTYSALMAPHSVEPLEEREFKKVLSGKDSDSEELKESFSQILSRVEEKETGLDDLKMQVDLEFLSAEEIYVHFQGLWHENPKRGLKYLRKVMFNKKVEPIVRGELLDHLHQSDMPREDFAHLTREVLGRPRNPEMFKKALYMHSESLPPGKRPRLVEELLERTEDPELRDMIIEYSESEGISQRGP